MPVKGCIDLQLYGKNDILGVLFLRIPSLLDLFCNQVDYLQSRTHVSNNYFWASQ
jgi:hypothetical protein